MKFLAPLVAWVFCFSLAAQAIVINLEKTPDSAAVKKSKKLVPIVIDARSPFEFATGHFSQSFNLRWQDFDQAGPGRRGELDPDYSLLARKLRVHGIKPDRVVVVLGGGPKGDGAEGRMAWMLAFLGVRAVEVKNFNNMKGRLTTALDDENGNVPPWEPVVQQNLRATKSEVGQPGSITIDVRPPMEFVNNHLPHAVNIPWTRFISESGEMLEGADVINVLKKENIDTSQRLIFYSNEGVRSGYVTFAVSRVGLNASNFDGGMNEWNIRP